MGEPARVLRFEPPLTPAQAADALAAFVAVLRELYGEPLAAPACAAEATHRG